MATNMARRFTDDLSELDARFGYASLLMGNCNPFRFEVEAELELEIEKRKAMRYITQAKVRESDAATFCASRIYAPLATGLDSVRGVRVQRSFRRMKGVSNQRKLAQDNSNVRTSATTAVSYFSFKMSAI